MINNVVLVGRLANDPEMRYRDDGTEEIVFQVTVTRPPRPNRQEQTDLLNVLCSGRAADNCPDELSTGSPVSVEGSLETRTYEQDGERQWWDMINARRVQQEQRVQAEGTGEGAQAGGPQNERQSEIMVNNAVMVGRLGTDPEMRYAQTGTEVTTFRIALDRPFTESGQEVTDWINIVCFGRVAENVAQYLDKGSLVGIRGRIQTRTYQQNGQQKRWTEVNARSVQFLESRQEAERRREQQGQPAAQPQQKPQQQQQQRQGQQQPPQPPAGQSYGAPGGQQQSGQQSSEGPPQEFDDMDEEGDPFGDV